ncbi:hypothetical protein EYZ11_006164 [Aspergillus tanneri]|uniref:Ubiquitin 3 binding protein But2 C-terminal domain-containing protein n=1 Tax=Aspergillus tanneri TaxID=1220188 RepID=A0A4S3JG69_9EURO|nr:uncharacterized protein ATNIH1004_003973 [Aspergillus tanneri]KAA8648090.1 hypothetical protein ATNIH1004_003973 [Aspergillus tanneri]THC94366.1 hypothetical protein EYZ11_006164 [Aspergillus tanneri]
MKSIILLLAVSATTLAASIPRSSIPQDNLLYPYATYRYWVQTGQFKEDPQDQLLVVKNGNPADETTTIVTFDVTPDLQGKRCKLLFDLWERDVSTGSNQTDVFTATKPTGASLQSKDKAAVQALSRETAEMVVQSRDVHTGRIKVTAPGQAEWVLSYDGYPEFDCPAGTMAGFEFVGVYDEVAIRWDIGVTGPRVQVL